MEETDYSWISELSLSNFRGFQKAPRVPLAPLTLVVGPNSSGKSSLFDAILLMAQSEYAFIIGTARVPTWIGSFVDLGSYQDTVFGHNERRAIRIGIQMQIPQDDSAKKASSRQHPITTDFVLRTKKSDPVGYLTSVTLTDETSSTKFGVRFDVARRNRVEVSLNDKSKVMYLKRGGRQIPLDLDDYITLTLKDMEKELNNVNKAAVDRIRGFYRHRGMFEFWRDVQRVSSGRARPKRWYALTGPESTSYYGNFFRGLLDDIHPNLLASAKRRERSQPWPYRYPDTAIISTTLRKLGFAAAITPDRLSAYHSSIKIKDNVSAVASNLIDVGYGVSQVLPVLLGCASDRTGMLFVEQPEMHLHPKAQGIVGELLAETSKKRQVVVETHSVHVINRARIMVAEGRLAASQVRILYVDKNASGSYVRAIGIDDSGEFTSTWPEGFFDERYEDTMQLLQLKKDK